MSAAEILLAALREYAGKRRRVALAAGRGVFRAPLADGDSGRGRGGRGCRGTERGHASG